jgi:hypothetical protein
MRFQFIDVLITALAAACLVKAYAMPGDLGLYPAIFAALA